MIWQMFIIVILLFLVAIQEISSVKTVHLSILSTSCISSLVQNGPSFSSMLINNTEYSEKKDGLNTIVINLHSSEIRANHFNFTTYYDEMEFNNKKTMQTFLKFVNTLPTDTLLVITTQNICNVGNDYLYFQLDSIKDLTLQQTTNSYWYNGGIVVACKGECAKAVQGKIPFTLFEVTSDRTNITFYLIDENYTAIATNNESTAKLRTIIGIVISIVVLAIVIMTYYCVFQRRKVRKEKLTNDLTTTVSIDENGCQSHSSSLSISNQIYESRIQVRPHLKMGNHLSCAKTKKNAESISRIQSPNEYSSMMEFDLNAEIVNNINSYGYLRPTVSRNDIYDTLEPRILLKPSQSILMFRKSFEELNRNDSVQTDNFAAYAVFKTKETKKSVIYKVPTNVPKFQPPTIKPKNLSHGSYINMTELEYENTYQALKKTDSRNDVYEILLLKE